MKILFSQIVTEFLDEDSNGKTHHIHRVSCGTCNAILAESHLGCCGFDLSGWGNMNPHKCFINKEQENAKQKENH